MQRLLFRAAGPLFLCAWLGSPGHALYARPEPAANSAIPPAALDPVGAALEKMQPEPGRKFRVDVITLTPIDAIYGIWGHTSLRVYNGDLGIDFIFDWGVFQFDSVFLVRFLKGQPAYILAARPTGSALDFYSRLQRTVYAQQIHMSDGQARALFAQLAVMAQPANRTYTYHHYRNNCTTKVRDIVSAFSADQVRNTFAARPSGKTFRESSSAYARKLSHWLGLNLIQGMRTDMPISAWEEMFLPIKLMEGLDEYRNARTLAGEPQLIGPKTLVMDGKPVDQATGWFFSATLTAVLIAIFFVLPVVFRHHARLAKIGRIARGVWHAGAGFIGIILAVLWSLPGNDSMTDNLNLLAFSPLYLTAFLVRPFLRHRPETMGRLYMGFAVLPLAGIFFVLTGIASQPALPFLVPAAVIQICIFLAHPRPPLYGSR